MEQTVDRQTASTPRSNLRSRTCTVSPLLSFPISFSSWLLVAHIRAHSSFTPACGFACCLTLFFAALSTLRQVPQSDSSLSS
ncbi:hypothetical protein C8R47DRAFT_1123415 [Mycena vitilis]|nr:hypothetical protein C8R47DRAFT_1123415 [Mycena vitilis]